MTKSDAKGMYLRYLGERTVNGNALQDPDLGDVFDGLLNSAVVFVGAAHPLRETFEVTEEDRDEAFFVKEIPADLAYVIKTLDKWNIPVPYERIKDSFSFERPCKVEYAKRPATIAPNADGSTVIDLDDRYAQLVPIKCAIDAAAGLEEYRYKVPALTAEFNTMTAALDDTNMPTYRRVL